MSEKSLIADETRQQKDKKKKDHESITRKYYTIPEEDLQLIIKKAKKGDVPAQAELFAVFDNFLKKYVALLFTKRADLRDYDIRRFIALFARKGYAAKIQRNQIDEGAYKEVNEVLRGLHYMVQRYCDKEDVEQTVYITFMQCIDRYERKGSIPFSGFLYNYFFYRLKKNVEEYLISQVGRKTFGLYTEDSVSSSSPSGENSDMSQINSDVQKQIKIEEYDVFTLGTDSIDEFWVSGETAAYPFTKLTINQRQLLKWRYIDGLKAPKIADKTSEHPNTCRAQLHKIREELEEILGDELSEYINFDLLSIDED
jgi:DNA-directed RNA polymerase specialized sigma24 family protein